MTQRGLTEAKRKSTGVRFSNGDGIEDYSDLPGFVKAAAVDELPKDVRFTDDAANGLFDAVKITLLNLGLVNLLGIFRSWKDFDDYRQVFEPVSYVNGQDVPALS